MDESDMDDRYSDGWSDGYQEGLIHSETLISEAYKEGYDDGYEQSDQHYIVTSSIKQLKNILDSVQTNCGDIKQVINQLEGLV